MATNQGDRQASVRGQTGTALTYEGDWHALFTLSGIPAGDFNGRFLAFINFKLGTSYTELNGAMYALAVSQGAKSWNELGAITFSVPGTLIGRTQGGATLSGRLTNSLKGSVSAGAVLAGGVSRKRALAGGVAGGASILANLSGGAGTMRGAIAANPSIGAKLTRSLKGAVAAAPAIAGVLSTKRALAGAVQGGATFTSALTGAGGAMPSGALGVWYASDYITSPKPQIPNSITSSVSHNLTPFPRRIFGNSVGGFTWQGGGATISNGTVAAPDGTNDASSIVTTGAWEIGYNTIYIPAGAYTVGIWAKSLSGSNYTAQFNNASVGETSSTWTITPTWQRFTFTGNNNSGSTQCLVRFQLLAASNVAVIDFDIYPGSVDLQERDTRAIFMGRSDRVNYQPTYASGELSLTSGWAGFSLPALSDTPFTLIGIVRKTTNVGAYQAFVASAAGTYTRGLSMFEESSGYQFARYNGASSPSEDANFKYLWGDALYAQGGLHMVGSRYDGTNLDTLVDGALHTRTAASVSSLSDGDFWIGQLGSDNGLTDYKLAAIAIWRSALTKTQLADAFAVLKARCMTNGLTFPTRRIYVAEGDSITHPVGSGFYSYPLHVGRLSSPRVLGSIAALSGARLKNNSGNSLYERAATVDQMIPPSTTDKYILSVMIGANDSGAVSGGGPLYTGGASAYAADLATYLDARRAAGWKVVVCTMLPLNGTGGNTFRNALNTILRGWTPGLHYDALCDFDSDSNSATYCTDAAAANTSYYLDGTHPNDTVQAALGAALSPVVNAI